MNDQEMREPLFEWMEEFFPKIRVLEEKNAGSSRADVIGVIEGALVGFEIKSDRDSYTRLRTQTKDYDDFCDYNYLVIGESHRRHAHEHIPPHWGILVVSRDEQGGQVKVEMDQMPARNEDVPVANQLSFLWRPELQTLLEWNELPLYKAKSKLFVQEKLLSSVEALLLKTQITEIQFERDYQLMIEQIEQHRREKAAKAGRRFRKKKLRTKRRKAKANV